MNEWRRDKIQMTVTAEERVALLAVRAAAAAGGGESGLKTLFALRRELEKTAGR